MYYGYNSFLENGSNYFDENHRFDKGFLSLEINRSRCNFRENKFSEENF